MARREEVRQAGARAQAGATASPAPDALARLRRLVGMCHLWEGAFYVDGRTVEKRIAEAVGDATVEQLAALAVEARHAMHLRQASLQLLVTLIDRARGNPLVSQTIARVCTQPDDPGELLAMYWQEERRPLSSQLKKGLALAVQQLDADALARYNRGARVTLRDVLLLAHAKPATAEQAAIWKLLVERRLPVPTAWYAALSAARDRKATWEQFLRAGSLDYRVILRSLRSMASVGVDDDLVRQAILARKGARHVRPLRFLAAARACPQHASVLDEALAGMVADMAPLRGRTIVLVDVSRSMDQGLSPSRRLTMLDAVATLASIVPGKVRVFTCSDSIVEVAPCRGLAGVDAVLRSQPVGASHLGLALFRANTLEHDRLIVVTAEGARDREPVLPAPKARRAYLMHVGSDRRAVDVGAWTRISGWSDSLPRFIAAHEDG